MIAAEKYIVFFVSKTISESKAAEDDFLFTYIYAVDRDKKIFSIVEWNTVLSDDQKLKDTINPRDIIFPEDGLHSQQDYKTVVGTIYDNIVQAENRNLIYDKISSLIKIDYVPGIVDNVAELVIDLCEETDKCGNAEERRTLYKEIWKWIEVLDKYSDQGYGEKWSETAHKRLSALNCFAKLLKHDDFHKEDLFLNAFIIRSTYIEMRIRDDCVDTITHGDIHGLREETRQSYIDKQKFYLRLFNSQMIQKNISVENHGGYPEDEIELILDIDQYLLSENSNVRIKTRENFTEISTDDERLNLIADQMAQTNQLFDLVCKNSSTEELLQCLKTSYERLRKYTEIIGAKAVCAECIERIAEINQKLEEVNYSENKNDRAENAFKALLGFKVSYSTEYDVFISYKHEDADVAKNLYHYLKKSLLHPFLDVYTLPELSNSEYEEAIMDALENSKHFVVIISDLKYLESFWVNLEMKTFQHEINEGRKEKANFLMVVSDQVADQIYITNKQCLHIRFRNCEIMKINEYKEKINKYFF